ncbi:E3 ubiquitin-protein ligase RHF2A-like [Typha latifolia]|uniref:E3 ubiquitin-protein ligase RHF2A-like n=1 Tax=Typha latifolia TaxID=4733 RepID=UPI003C2D192B
MEKTAEIEKTAEMEKTAEIEGHLQSAAAFVEGGIQDACDDSCSICLEAFCDSDPATVTSCKHEFHLQCILEWCQRSSQCPMCWQPISLKDPTSQELLEAIQQERSVRVNRSRSAAIFHHPVLRDFELQHLPVGADDDELEERIIQHLAAAAAMGRTHHIARREGLRSRAGAHGRSQFLVFSTTQGPPSLSSLSTSSVDRGENDPVPALTAPSPLISTAAVEEGPPYQASQVNFGHADQVATLPSISSATFANSPGPTHNRNPAGQSSPVRQDRAGPSDFHSFSESVKSRLNAVSTRYKDSITKSTRGWKERLFSRNNAISDLGSEVRREVNAGIATVSRMMERLETRDRPGSSPTSTPTRLPTETANERVTSDNTTGILNDASSSTSCAASSGSK